MSMRILKRNRPVAVAFALVATGLLPSGAKANDPPSVIVVFDGSGSMWGNMEGVRQSKLVLARDALRRSLGRIEPLTRIGLASFGHRRGDCGDVETMRQPEVLDVERIMAPLMQLNPRGRGPITLSLRESAKALVRTPGRRSIVLIHDDADNCQADLCAAATELRASGLTVHAVGIGVKPEDVPKMACLTQSTGGRYFNAQSPDQVTSAIDEALRLASGDPRAPAAPAAPAQGAGAPGPAPAMASLSARLAPVPSEGPPALYLRAQLAPNAEPLGLPLNWTVFAEGQPEIPLFDGRAANPVVQVAPGRYVVEAREGAVSANRLVDVGDKGPTAAVLVLNAGAVRVRAVAQKAGPAPADAIISIADAADAKGAAPVAVFKGSEGTSLLPAGRYLARVEHGLVRAERAVAVTAGSQTSVDVPLNSARVQLATPAREGGVVLEPPIYSIVEDDPDAPRGRREVARSAARQAEFVLPPGTYYVIARLGGVEARELLAVGAGDVVRRTFSAVIGRLTLATRVPAGLPQGEAVSYRVERLDAVPPEVTVTSRPAPVLLLPGGRYRVEGRYGAMNARSVREIELKAGQGQHVVLEHQAASLKLRLTGSAGPAEVFWDIRDEAGQPVWTTGQIEPTATLQAGRYVVRAELREKRHERTVELRAGELKLLELAAD